MQQSIKKIKIIIKNKNNNNNKKNGWRSQPNFNRHLGEQDI
jgi:hypothetical protein